jgi:hypothetical protein
VAPGTTPANGARVVGVSCVPHGDCTALVDAGLNTTNGLASYVVTEHGGVWGSRVRIPGLTKIAPAGFTMATGLSCPASGSCLVTGIYAYGTGYNSTGGFTVWESNGKWQAPATIPGLTKLNTAGFGFTTHVACSSAITCVVAGTYGTGASSSPKVSAFIAEELHGIWKPAIQVPGLPKPSSGYSVAPTVLSCASIGNCVLGLGAFGFSVGAGAGASPMTTAPLAAIRGAHWLAPRAAVRSLAQAGARQFATAATSLPQARAAIETGGVWQKAMVVGPSVGTNGLAVFSGAACPATGKCVLAGIALTSTSTASGLSTASFVITQSGTVWSKPKTFASVGIFTLACPAAGGCVAGGTDTKGVAAIIQQQNGAWGTAKELPGATALSHGTTKAQQSEVDILACPSAGNCSVGGSYSWTGTSSVDGEIFVGGESNGTWAPVKVPAGIAALNTGLIDSFTSLSCASAATCAAGGDYYDAKTNPGAFLIVEKPAH